MATILVVALAIAVLFGLGFLLGGPLIAVILAVVVLVAGAVYLLAMGGSRRTPGDVARSADEQEELLGPGGADDPDR